MQNCRLPVHNADLLVSVFRVSALWVFLSEYQIQRA